MLSRSFNMNELVSEAIGKLCSLRVTGTTMRIINNIANQICISVTAVA